VSFPGVRRTYQPPPQRDRKVTPGSVNPITCRLALEAEASCVRRPRVAFQAESHGWMVARAELEAEGGQFARRCFGRLPSESTSVLRRLTRLPAESLVPASRRAFLASEGTHGLRRRVLLPAEALVSQTLAVLGRLPAEALGHALTRLGQLPSDATGALLVVVSMAFPTEGLKGDLRRADLNADSTMAWLVQRSLEAEGLSGLTMLGLLESDATGSIEVLTPVGLEAEALAGVFRLADLPADSVGEVSAVFLGHWPVESRRSLRQVLRAAAEASGRAVAGLLIEFDVTAPLAAPLLVDFDVVTLGVGELLPLSVQWDVADAIGSLLVEFEVVEPELEEAFSGEDSDIQRPVKQVV